MNRPAHVVLGAAAGAGGYYLASKIIGFQPTWGQALFFGGAGAVMGCLSDLLEPATNPHHRAFFHSVVFNGGIALVIHQILCSPNVDPGTKILVTAFGFAYLSHPIVDAMTPMGLPLI